MKYVVWGTGIVAEQYMNRCSKEICFFLDNDIDKKGKLFYNKKIVHPSEIESWDNIHVIIAVKNRKPIESQLNSYGMQEGLDYSAYCESISKDDFDTIENEINRKLEWIKSHKEWANRIIYLGTSFANSKLVRKSFVEKYFKKWEEDSCNEKFLYFFEEGSKIIDEEMSEKNSCFNLEVFSKIIFSHNTKVQSAESECIQFVLENEELSLAASCYRRKYLDAPPQYEFKIIYYYYTFLKGLVESLQPKSIIMWNEFTAYHKVAFYVCTLEKVPVVFVEYGVLPGTLNFDTIGQMGESAPAVYAKEFLQLPISKEEFECAGKVWRFIRENNLNRRKQWKEERLEEVKEKLDFSKPTIFFAGQHDVTAGIYPYTEKTRKHHSPVFQSSVQAAEYLAEIAEKNNWNFVFKPHPQQPLSSEEVSQMPQNCFIADGASVNYLIDLADVTVTIASQTAYMALLRNKPVLLLGHLQLKDKGCAYQAFDKNVIEEELTRSIKYGFTDEQKRYFQKHIAQLLKYYTYDDYDEERTYRYGKEIPSSVDEIWWLEKKLHEIRKNERIEK